MEASPTMAALSDASAGREATGIPPQGDSPGSEQRIVYTRKPRKRRGWETPSTNRSHFGRGNIRTKNKELKEEERFRAIARAWPVTTEEFDLVVASRVAQKKLKQLQKYAQLVQGEQVRLQVQRVYGLDKQRAVRVRQKQLREVQLAIDPWLKPDGLRSKDRDERIRAVVQYMKKPPCIRKRFPIIKELVCKDKLVTAQLHQGTAAES